MSEKVQSFNPILILVWIIQLIILAMDYSKDNKVSWSIPVIGSFLLIQLYMVWKTNYDEMMEERRQTQLLSKGSPILSTPSINPGVTDLQSVHSDTSTQPAANIVQLNLAPSVTDDKEMEE